MSFENKLFCATALAIALCLQASSAQQAITQAPKEKEAENKTAGFALPGGSNASANATGGVSVQTIAIAVVAVGIAVAAASSSSSSPGGTVVPSGTTGTK